MLADAFRNPRQASLALPFPDEDPIGSLMRTCTVLRWQAHTKAIHESMAKHSSRESGREDESY
jgi:hypothetical protein